MKAAILIEMERQLAAAKEQEQRIRGIATDVLTEMKKLEGDDNDYEIAHCKADELLCCLLLNLGYNEIVDSYNKVGKWYA